MNMFLPEICMMKRANGQILGRYVGKSGLSKSPAQKKSRISELKQYLAEKNNHFYAVQILPIRDL